MTTTIAISEENRWLLLRIKQDAGLRSLDEAVSQLLRCGEHTIERLLALRRAEVEAACHELGITRLTAFGSRVWGAPHAASDVDLVAEFRERQDLFSLQDARDRLAEAFGAPVDLVTWGGLRPRLAQRIRERGVDLLA